MDTKNNRWRVVNTWNGGKGGRVVAFESSATGDNGHNECFLWVHRNTPFSFHEATTRQGYVVEQIPVAPVAPFAPGQAVEVFKVVYGGYASSGMKSWTKGYTFVEMEGDHCVLRLDDNHPSAFRGTTVRYHQKFVRAK